MLCPVLSQSLARQPRRSDPFALLIPLTPQAHDMLKHRLNRVRLTDPTLYSQLPKVPTKKRQYIAKLDFTTLIGRQCFSFGTARSNTIKFPIDSGVSQFHFNISIDVKQSRVVLSDDSLFGLWIGHSRNHGFELLHKETTVLDLSLIHI